jgi:hypothetical protein
MRFIADLGYRLQIEFILKRNLQFEVVGPVDPAGRKTVINRNNNNITP